MIESEMTPRTIIIDADEPLDQTMNAVFDMVGPDRPELLFAIGQLMVKAASEARDTAVAAEREDAGYLADAAVHMADHIKQVYPGFYCEDEDNVRHFAAKVRALLAVPDEAEA